MNASPRHSYVPGAFLLLLALIFSGCGDSASDPNKSSASGTNSAASASAAPKDRKTCFTCAGEGMVACRAPGCVSGKTECPGPCMKLTRGNWIHMNVAGHDPSELWMKFPNTSGKGGYQAWNHHHVGEVVVYQGGQAVNIGACKVCNGSTKVDCRVCKGQGKAKCELCKGDKFVPIAWTATDNPWLNSQSDVIRLKDGQVLLGKVALSNAQDLTIRTRDGKSVHVSPSDILPKGRANSPPSTNSTSKL
jgi:hypothetical protein